MKTLFKVVFRYIASAAGVALILLILNITLVFLWYSNSGKEYKLEYQVSEISKGLIKQNGSYQLSDAGRRAIHKRYQWAMLINNQGKVVWEDNLPKEIPRSYNVSEAAGFSRWYLKDYPVYCWRHPDGLMVLGSKKDSAWKLGIELPEQKMKHLPGELIMLLVLNGFAAIILAMLFGLRVFHSLKRLMKGIEDIADKKAVMLAENGLFGELAAKLNQTSDILIKQDMALKRRDDARTTWIAGVSHDIRTPLSVVMGYASQLEESGELNGEEREHARSIRVQSEKIKSLILDLNLASKLEYNMQPLRKTLVYPAALIRAVVADFINSGLGENYSIGLNLSKDVQSSVLSGDEKLLRRAFENLIGNSIRHNPEGCDIMISAEKERDIMKITISDHGTGYPKNVIESFHNPNIPRELPSHGLGLTIVRQIVEAHGGTIRIANQSEGGCNAEVDIPVDRKDR